MAVSIVSGIPIFAGPLNIVTSIQAPNIPGGGAIGIGDVIGLQAALDTKLEDVAGTIAPTTTTVTITGVELNYLGGATSNIQTQLDGKVDIAGDTMTGSLLMDTSAQILIDAAGSALPGLAVNGDTDTGIYGPSADALGFAVGGADALYILSNGLLRAQTASYETLLSNDNDIPNKKYVDDEIVAATGGPFLPLAGGTMTGNLNLNLNQITLDADVDSYFVSLVDDVVTLFIAGSPGFIFDAACLDVQTKAIKNVVDPTAAQEAATKNYVDTEIVNLNLGGTGPFLQLAGGTMTGAINMGTNLITNVVDPTNPQEAATKNYVDTEIVNLNLGGTGPFLQLAGGIMTGAIDMGASKVVNAADPTLAQDLVTLAYAQANFLDNSGGVIGPLSNDLDAGGNNIINVADPVNPQDAATKAWTEANFLDLPGTSAMTGSIDMGGNTITNLAAATANDEAVNLGQSNSLYLRIDGTSLATGTLNMNGNPITGVTDPTGAQEAATKNYVDSNFLDLAGTSAMTGALNMGGFAIGSLLDPTSAQQAATKNYVDTEISGLNLGTTYVAKAGDAMTGNLQMGLGAQFQADDGLLATPSYAFVSSSNSGWWWDGTNVRLSVNALSGMTISPSTGTNEVNVHGRTIAGVGNPTADDEAVNLGTLNAFSAAKLLGSVTGVNMLSVGTTDVYTVPVGKSHIILHVIVVPTDYTPGASPTNPDASVQTDASGVGSIVATQAVDWGGTAGAADQASYLTPKNGALTPNASTTIRFRVDTAASGTFSALTATVYVIGIEL